MPPKKKLKVSEPTKSSNKDSESNSPRERHYWLMKAEPESRIERGVDVKFGIDDLQNEPDQTACWDGVRNYQARNFMRDQMKIGDLAFFYHSNCKSPGIAGIMEIVREGYVDHTQFDKKAPYYDSSATKAKPKWFMVDVKFKRKFKRFIPLTELKFLYQKHKDSEGPLKSMALFTRSRLSVQPVAREEFDYIVQLEEQNGD